MFTSLLRCLPGQALLLLVLWLCEAQAIWTKSHALDVLTAAESQLLTSHSWAQDADNKNITLAVDEPLPPAATHDDATSLTTTEARKLSRGKRFVAFPVGSSLSAAVCLTTGVLGNPHYLFLSFGLNWGIAYDLPNATWVVHNLHGWGDKKTKATLIKRRHRRDLYGRLEAMISSAVSAAAHDITITSNAPLAIFMRHNSSHKTGAAFCRNDHGNGNDNGHGDAVDGNILNDLWPTTQPPKLMTMMKRANMPKTTPEILTTNKSCQHVEQTGGHAGISLHQRWRRALSRPRRYISFPEGSSFSVAVCFTVGIIGNPYYAYNSFGLNWGVAYDLPNTTWVLNHLHGFAQQPVAPPVLRRRTRRSLYQNIETIINNMGYNGRDCIMRTLCESRQYFLRTKMSMIGEMLRVIFSLPKQRLFTRELSENADIEHYDRAYRYGHTDDCERMYMCPFSLLELAFGKYATPPKNYYA